MCIVGAKRVCASCTVRFKVHLALDTKGRGSWCIYQTNWEGDGPTGNNPYIYLFLRHQCLQLRAGWRHTGCGRRDQFINLLCPATWMSFLCKFINFWLQHLRRGEEDVRTCNVTLAIFGSVSYIHRFVNICVTCIMYIAIEKQRDSPYLTTIGSLIEKKPVRNLSQSLINHVTHDQTTGISIPVPLARTI